MDIGSAIFIIILLIILFHSKSIKALYLNTLILSMVTNLMVERGYFLKIGSYQLTYGNFCDIFLLFIGILFMGKGKLIVYKEQIIAWSTCLVLLIISWIMLIIDPTKAIGANFNVAWDDILVKGAPLQNITFTFSMVPTILQILLFIIISFITYMKLKKDDWLYVFARVVKFSDYIFVVNLIELATKYILHSNIYDQIVDGILGVTKSTSSELVLRGSGVGLNGLTKETSHYAFILIILFILNYAFLILNKHSKKGDKVKYVMTMIVMEAFLMMSFSMLYFGSILLITMGILKTYNAFGIKGVSSFIAIFIMGVLIVVIYGTTLTNNLTTSGFWGRRILSLEQELGLVFNHEWLSVAAPNALEWSNRVRLGSTYETFLLFRYRPLIGLGMGSVTAHSSLAMLITGGGFLGSISFLNIFFWLRKCQIFVYNKFLFYICSVAYCLMNLFNSLSFNPFIDTWTMILVFALLILSSASFDWKINSSNEKG